MTFHVGQKVVCVEGTSGHHVLVLGQVYTIARIGMFGRALHVDVVECSTDIRLGWRAARFRPVVERKTDISVFTAMLKPSKVRV